MKSKSILIVLGALLVAGGTAPATPRALEYSTKPWLNRSSGRSGAAYQVAPASASADMTCLKCTNSTMIVKRDVGTKPWQGRKEIAVSVHQCPACRDEMVRRQASKDAVLVHACRDCGSQSVSCCATTQAKEPTRGMM